MNDYTRHPAIYTEFDLEAARKAGQQYGARKENERLLEGLKQIGSGGDFYEVRWTALYELFLNRLWKDL